jgi:hypothetical protein
MQDPPHESAEDRTGPDEEVSTEEEEARAARARRLREEIEGTADQRAGGEQAPEHENPREFIERRMRELESEDEVESEPE